MTLHGLRMSKTRLIKNKRRNLVNFLIFLNFLTVALVRKVCKFTHTHRHKHTHCHTHRRTHTHTHTHKHKHTHITYHISHSDTYISSHTHTNPLISHTPTQPYPPALPRTHKHMHAQTHMQ